MLLNTHCIRNKDKKNARIKCQIWFDVYFLRFRFVSFCSHSEYFNGENLMKKLKLEVKNIDSVMWKRAALILLDFHSKQLNGRMERKSKHIQTMMNKFSLQSKKPIIKGKRATTTIHWRRAKKNTSFTMVLCNCFRKSST